MEAGRTEMQRMLGNAVPSLMADVLARQISGQPLDLPVTGRLKLLPPRRKYVPPPEKTPPLPEQYRCLIGSHEEHKGTGKGPAAIERAREKAWRAA